MAMDDVVVINGNLTMHDESPDPSPRHTLQETEVFSRQSESEQNEIFHRSAFGNHFVATNTDQPLPCDPQAPGAQKSQPTVAQSNDHFHTRQPKKVSCTPVEQPCSRLTIVNDGCRRGSHELPELTHRPYIQSTRVIETKAASLPPPPPPPSHPIGQQQLPGVPVSGPPPPPPPPPPPAAALHALHVPPSSVETSYRPENDVSSPSAFIPVSYSGENMTDASRFIRIDSCRRNVLMLQHQLKPADLAEHMWLLRDGITEMWYEKPSRASMKTIKALEGTAHGSLDLAPLFDARPVSLEVPKVLASVALTTPTDDDAYECDAGHIEDGTISSAICHQCSERRSESLDDTALVYTLILTTCQASTPFIHGAHFNGKQIYKLVKCGSREAAVAEAFHAAGINGWNVVFSCVTRLGEDFEDRFGHAKRVFELWNLSQSPEHEQKVDVFY